jgi:hypothetical protein
LGDNIWSVRIGRRHRALALKTSNENEYLWFWIGSHAEYNHLYTTTKALEKGQAVRRKPNI